jgi:DNA-binding GntR family transcriptional regulator
MLGVWPQNTRLEAMRIADDYGISMTPVRDSLNLLAGEGLIISQAGAGYRTKVVTERSLAAMLGIHATLIGVAVAREARLPVKKQVDPLLSTNYPDEIGVLFQQIASSAGNPVLAEFVERLGDRLYQCRAHEHLVLLGIDAELHELKKETGLWSSRLGHTLEEYHQRRIKNVAQLAALIA